MPNSELIQVMEQVAAHLAADGYVDTGKFLHNWAAQLHHILIKETASSPLGEDQSQAYINLIQALLDSPRSKVTEVLAQHQELIGPGLVAMMKKVAIQVEAQGEPEAAHFLKELALELNRAWLQAHAFEPPLEQKTTDRRTQAVPPAPPPAPPMPPPKPTSAVAKPPAPPVPMTKPAAVSSSTGAGTSSAELVEHLAQFTQALDRLHHTLSTRLQPFNPLWYMEVLERAQTSDWVLTAAEVEQLIGVKPACPVGKESYHRGCWVFQKAGRIGTQTAWRVVKETNA